MEKTRTPISEKLAQRLEARRRSVARVGPGASFYGRMGMADPTVSTPAEDELGRMGAFSFVSARRYYTEMQARRQRMMYRLMAIRQAEVSSERLRSVGPRFAAEAGLPGVQRGLPRLAELGMVTLNSQPAVAQEADEPDLPVRRRRDREAPRRRRAGGRQAAIQQRLADRASAAALPQRPAVAVSPMARMSQRVVAPQDKAFTATLDRVAALVQRTRPDLARQVQAIDALAPETREVEVIRIVRSLERPTERMVARTVAREVAESSPRPAAVAQKRMAPTVQPGVPKGLQRVLTASPMMVALTGQSAPPVHEDAESVPLRSARRTAERRRPGRRAPASARIANAWVDAQQQVDALVPRRLGTPMQAVPYATRRAEVRSTAGVSRDSDPAPLSGAATRWMVESSPRRVRPPVVAEATGAPIRRPARLVAATAPEMAVLRTSDEAASLEVESATAASRTVRRVAGEGTRASRGTVQERVLDESAPMAPRVTQRATVRASRRGRRAGTQLARALSAREERAAPASVEIAAEPATWSRTATSAVPKTEGAAALMSLEAPRRRSERSSTRPIARIVARIPESAAVEAEQPVLRSPVVRQDRAPFAPQRRVDPTTGNQESAIRTVTAPTTDWTVIQPQTGRSLQESDSAEGPSVRSELRQRASAARRTLRERPVSAPPVGEDAASPTGAGAGRHRPVVPATRRALHRTAPLQSVRAPITTSPLAFVNAVNAQRELNAVPETTPTRSVTNEHRATDRPMARAAVRAVDTTRVDHRDRPSAIQAPTDYLKLTVPRVTAVPSAPGIRSARGRTRAPRAVATSRQQTRSALGTPRVAPEGLAREAEAPRPPSLQALERSARRAIVPPSWAAEQTLAIRPVVTTEEPVVAEERLSPSEPKAWSMPAVRRAQVADRAEVVNASLATVTQAYRAGDRASFQVVRIPAVRRVAEAVDHPGRPTTVGVEARLVEDASGQLVRASARSLVGTPAMVAMQAAGDAEMGAAEATVRGRTQASVGRRSGTRVAPRTAGPAEWAEERGQVVARPGVRPSPGAASTRVAQRAHLPVPERRLDGRSDTRRALVGPPIQDGEAVTSRGSMPGSIANRWIRATADRSRSVDPGTTAQVLASPVVGSDEQGELEAGERRMPSNAARRRVARRNVPVWARRSLQPDEASDSGEGSSRTAGRAVGGGLLGALARASDAEEIIRVIVERRNEIGSVARELPSAAGQALHGLAEATAQGTTTTVNKARRGDRGDTFESRSSRGLRAEGLRRGQTRTSRSVRSGTGQTLRSETQDGLGSNNVMKLANKLMKLIHLAEHDRLDDAQRQVRMAPDTAEARRDAEQGQGSDQISDENMHMETLLREVTDMVQKKLDLDEERGGSDGNGWW